MGAIKWTGKAFKLVGRILTAEDLEEWMENEGKAFLEDRIASTSHKWFRGKARAVKGIENEVIDLTKKSDAFKEALNNSLERLPLVIARTGDKFQGNAPVHLFEKSNMDWILALPRVVVRMAYRQIIIDELSDVAELSEYPGLASVVLGHRADEAESAFFKKNLKNKEYLCDPDGYVLVGGDGKYQWLPDEESGHYYLVYDFTGLPDLGRRDGRLSFHRLFSKLIREFPSKIGGMKKNDHNDVQKYLHRFIADLSSVEGT